MRKFQLLLLCLGLSLIVGLVSFNEGRLKAKLPVPEKNFAVAKFGNPFPNRGIMNLNTSSVKQYEENYDKSPLIYSEEGFALKGFAFGKGGYSKMVANKDIQGIFLRLAKKPDGSLTIMIVGMDADGKILEDLSADASGATAFDNLPICPPECP